VLPVVLDCPFLIAPSVFSNVYFRSVSCVPGVTSVSGLPLRYFLTFIFVLCLVLPVLPVSMYCPFLISPSVLSTVYFRPVSCVPGVTSVSGLSLRFSLTFIFVLCLVYQVRTKINVRKYRRGNSEKLVSPGTQDTGRK
jgi:hypothetical protein